MKFIDDKTIELGRELNDLDLFVLKFINVLKKYTGYVIISGYVSILLGRSRGTEDVDLFMKPLDKEKFIKLYHELKESGFWCLNAESDNEVYSYLEEGIAVRFANKGETIPNIEVKFARKLLDLEVFTDFITVKTEKGIIKISSLERQIAFKRYYLCSDKDLEDAKHLEETFKEQIDREKIKNYKVLLEKYGKT